MVVMDKENIDGLSNFEEDDIEEIIEIEDNEDVTGFMSTSTLLLID